VPRTARPTSRCRFEKPETLLTLQQDAAHLHQALDRAGVPADGRQITFELAAPAGADSQGNSTGGGAQQGGGFSGTPGQSGGGANPDAQRGYTPRAQASATFTGDADASTNRAASVTQADRAHASRISGINITA
jgi:hypothetical protein